MLICFVFLGIVVSCWFVVFRVVLIVCVGLWCVILCCVVLYCAVLLHCVL